MQQIPSEWSSTSPAFSPSLDRLPSPDRSSTQTHRGSKTYNLYATADPLKQNKEPRLRVLIAANGDRDVNQAEALIVRLHSEKQIECRVITDRPTARIDQYVPVTGNYRREPILRKDQEAEDDLDNRRYRLFCNERLIQHEDYVDVIAHSWAEWADLLVLAPIDADTLSKMLAGIEGSSILHVLRIWDVSKKIILVPGMSTNSWENPITKKQLSKLRRKWTHVRVMGPILWHYDDAVGPKKVFLGWDGFNDLVQTIKNQAELMTFGHDVEAPRSANNVSDGRSNVPLPPELWSLILRYTDDWELAQNLGIYTNLPAPKEWNSCPSLSSPGPVTQAKDNNTKFMRELEWTFLTLPPKQIIETLDTAPASFTDLSPLCVKLVIKFNYLTILQHLSSSPQHAEAFWSSFGGTILPTKASAVFARPEILEWWRTSPRFLNKNYTADAVDGASRQGFIDVLEWWRQSGLVMKYTEAALESASGRGRVNVLEWWKEASQHHQSSQFDEAEKQSQRRLYSRPPSPPSPAIHTYPHAIGHSNPNSTLKLKVGKSILVAAQNGRANVVRWWDDSGIPYSHSEAVAKIASAYGHVNVLETWKSCKGDEFGMLFDSSVLVGPTKNGWVRILEWWRQQTLPQDGDKEGKRLKVEYKTCDIEEALEDSVHLEGSEGEEEVRKWWAKNGLNLGVGTSEWMKLKQL